MPFPFHISDLLNKAKAAVEHLVERILACASDLSASIGLDVLIACPFR